MARLPDPRRYGAFAPNDRLGRLIARNAGGDADARRELLGWLGERLQQGRDAQISEALERIPDHDAYTKFWNLVCLAADHGDIEEDAAVAVRLFAVPLILVAAARAAAVVSGTLGDIEAIRALFERHAAVGTTRNFGLSNALCSADALDRLTPGRVYRWSRDWSRVAHDFPPEAIEVQPGREQVYLRFLVGGGVTARDAPSFLETASHIGAWGMAVTRELMSQLSQPALDLLAMPRAPVTLLRAPHAGRCAQLEAAFDLFVSSTVRQFRSTVGDPAVAISAHRHENGGAEIRVSMSSSIDATLLDGFRWPLHPLDDIDAIVATTTSLLRDCRIQDLRLVDRLLPERLASGRLFMRVEDDIPAAAAWH